MTTKTDMERVGLFKELGYHTISDPYKSPAANQFNASSGKGKQLLPGGLKSRSATSAGYFNEFARVFDGEAYSDPIKERRKFRAESNKSNIAKNWVYNGNSKSLSGIGSYMGTFSGPIEHFSAISKSKSELKETKKNIVTNPIKLGTGYGYVNVTLNKYPEYKADNYDRIYDLKKKEIQEHKEKIKGKGVFALNMASKEYFDANPYKGNDKPTYYTNSNKSANKDIKPFKPTSPSKFDGGMKAGCLNPFPEYPSNKYSDKLIMRPVQVVNSSGKTYIPNSGPKGMPTNSILYQNVYKSITPINYKTTTSVISY